MFENLNIFIFIYQLCLIKVCERSGESSVLTLGSVFTFLVIGYSVLGDFLIVL